MNTLPKTKQIFGISGLPRSGKDTVADALIEHGYFGVSLGDIVRDAARVRHAEKSDPISVKNMTETSNWLRKSKGPDFALKEALRLYEAASKQQDYLGLVVYSVRAPIEVDFILGKGGEMVWIETSDEIRYERNKRAQREGEADISQEEFLAQESLQWTPQPGLPEAIQMNINYVKSHATITIMNEGDNVTQFLEHALKQLNVT